MGLRHAAANSSVAAVKLKAEMHLAARHPAERMLTYLSFSVPCCFSCECLLLTTGLSLQPLTAVHQQ